MERDITEQKKALRKQVKQLKANLTNEYKKEQSSIIFKHIETLDVFKNSQNILLYWSLDDEVSTHDFVNKWSEKKTIFLPVIDGETLKIVRFIDQKQLIKETKFGVCEPCGEQLIDTNKLDLIIVPGVAFDINNNRMGRGRAFYDKLLKTTPALKIGICFPCQLFPQVPFDDNDIKMNIVISQ